MLNVVALGTAWYGWRSRRHWCSCKFVVLHKTEISDECISLNCSFKFLRTFYQVRKDNGLMKNGHMILPSDTFSYRCKEQLKGQTLMGLIYNCKFRNEIVKRKDHMLFLIHLTWVQGKFYLCLTLVCRYYFGNDKIKVINWKWKMFFIALSYTIPSFCFKRGRRVVTFV